MMDISGMSNDDIVTKISQMQDEAVAGERHAGRRFATFLVLHTVTLLAELYVFVVLCLARWWWAVVALAGISLFSGLFCSYAAWNIGTNTERCSLLPLKERSFPLNCLLLIPYGWGQGVIFALAYDDYRQSTGAPLKTSSGTSITSSGANKFHCKAVNGIFEGIPFGAVLLYMMWNVNFPSKESSSLDLSHLGFDDPLLLEISILAASIIFVFNAGLGLLELDLSTSERIEARTRANFAYPVFHVIFRTIEVYTRVAIWSFFFVVTLTHHRWMDHFDLFTWEPIVLIPSSIFATLILVSAYGGFETTFAVQLLCAVPSTFANIFLFIDSPYKQRAARKLSRALTIRNFVEPLVLACIAVLSAIGTTGTYDGEECEGPECLRMCALALVKKHVKSTGFLMSCTLLYLPLLVWISSDAAHGDHQVDIYSACEAGDAEAVQELTSQAVCVNVNRCDVHGETPLMLAVQGAHLEVIEILLKEGALVDARALTGSDMCCNCTCRCRKHRNDWTALHFAAHLGDADVVRALIGAIAGGSNGSQPTSAAFIDGQGNTPLHIAACRGHSAAVQVIVQFVPGWACVRNARGHKPEACSTVHEVQVALGTVPTAGHAPVEQEMRKSAVLPLVANAAPPAGGEASASSPRSRTGASSPRGGGSSPRRSRKGSWRVERMNISQSNVDRQQLEAPGLCSFLAASSGGALGRVFLVDTLQGQHANIRGLDMVPEDAVALAIQLSDPLAMTRSDSLVEEGSASAPTNGAEDTQVPPPGIEDLDAIDRDGNFIDWWMQLVAAQRESGRPMAGNIVAHAPDEATLGTGSYGRVWRGRDRRTGVWYAVKNIKVQRRTNNAIAKRECEVADHIRVQPHPCVVQLFAVHHFQEASLFSLIMEFCPAGDIKGQVRREKERAREVGRLYVPPRSALSWIAQVFVGLEHLHIQMRTLLRDLKPDNVVLSESGRAKITDFGFSRIGTEALGTWTFGVPPGSPGYVSPEVLRAERYNSSADLYSFGVLIWVMLTGGVVSFVDPAPPTMIGRMTHANDYKALFKDVELLTQCVKNPDPRVAQQIHGDAQDFVLQLINKRPANRPNHEGIRKHAFMAALNLPPLGARPEVIDEWLSKLNAASW